MYSFFAFLAFNKIFMHNYIHMWKTTTTMKTIIIWIIQYLSLKFIPFRFCICRIAKTNSLNSMAKKWYPDMPPLVCPHRTQQRGIKRRILVAFIKGIVYQQCISKVNTKIPREKIKKVLMINVFIKSGMIETFIIPFERKLHNVLVNLAQVLTNNPLQVDFNSHLFYYFS